MTSTNSNISTPKQTNAWGVISSPPKESMNFAEIMSEEYAQHVQDQEIKRYEKKVTKLRKSEAKASNNIVPISYLDAAVNQRQQEQLSDDSEWEDFSELIQNDAGAYEVVGAENVVKSLEGDSVCDSDAVIAQMLQSQFDHEHNEELRRIEQKRNKQSKVTVTLDKYRRNGDLEFLNEPDEVDDVEPPKCDWDRFETNEKILDGIPKCGFKVVKEGEIITKHDPQLCGVRNACRVMSFPPEFATGDGTCFDMKLSNKVYNQLKTYSHRDKNSGKRNKKLDRKDKIATTELGLDENTRLIIYKFISSQVLKAADGIVCTGKEAVILHAYSDPSCTGLDTSGLPNRAHVVLPSQLDPRECAIKVFKTTLNEFKQRDRYIKDDFRFKDRFKKQGNRDTINMWAEKEMHNLIRMRDFDMNCPGVKGFRENVLVMSFIGDNNNAAPKLKNARLTDAELSCAYEEIVAAMHKMYNEVKLVHADLSEYNILWYGGKCWFIDMAQSVEPNHPGALEYLMRDCSNIINFFTKRGLPNIYTKEQLFEYITSLNAETYNVNMLERMYTGGASEREATAPNQEECPEMLKPLTYPFDLAWEKSMNDRDGQLNQKVATTSTIIDTATANAMQVLSISLEQNDVNLQKLSSETKPTTTNTNNTAEN